MRTSFATSQSIAWIEPTAAPKRAAGGSITARWRSGSPITCEEDAQALFEIAVKAGYDNEGRRPIWSVASDGVFEFIASWSLPMDWPEASPRYE
jgi:hypothetical protein